MSSIKSDSKDRESVEHGGGSEEEEEVAGSSGLEERGVVGVVVSYAGDVSSADGLRGAADQTFMLLCHSGRKRRRGGRE